MTLLSKSLIVSFNSGVGFADTVSTRIIPLLANHSIEPKYSELVASPAIQNPANSLIHLGTFASAAYASEDDTSID